MKSLFGFVWLCALLLTGCATARLYPVQGPLAQENPPPVYVAKLTGALDSGSFTAKLSDGEVCQGHWAVIPRPKSSAGSNAVQTDTLAAEWDIVYGPGFYTAHVLGARLYARASLTGNKGTQLNVEMYKPYSEAANTPAAIRGVAKDSKGNVYKLAF